jgi:hypothetical protein
VAVLVVVVEQAPELVALEIHQLQLQVRVVVGVMALVVIVLAAVEVAQVQ